MPDLMIKPAPRPPSSATENANALKRSDAGKQSEQSPKTDSATESPFAAVLKAKSRVEQQAAEETKRTTSSAAADPAEAATVVADLAALLPLLTANSAAVAPPATSTDGAQAAAQPDASSLPGLQATPEPATLPLVAAATPVQMGSGLPTAPNSILATNQRKQNLEARNELPSASGSAKSAEAGQVAGKFALDTAIPADADHAESKSAELPVNNFQALLERAAGMAPATSTASSRPTLRIETPLGQGGWHEEIGQKLTWMAGSNSQQADLVLNPPQLGRVEVSLTMNGDQASAVFTSANPAVREALENSLHRLREVLANAGVSLGQTHVGSESPQQSARRDEADFGGRQGVRYASSVSLPGVGTVAGTGAGRSMIDIFA